MTELGPNTYMEICSGCSEPFKCVHTVHRMPNTSCYWCQRGTSKPNHRLHEDRMLLARQEMGAL